MPHTHQHDRKTELNVFWIPADTDIPMEMKVIGADWQSMSRLVDGYIEVVRSTNVPDLYCGCPIIMVVNEEGMLQNMPDNLRATTATANGAVHAIRGDVFLIGEGLVKSSDPDEGPEPDFISLHSALSRWEGPGHPLPVAL